MSLAFLIFCICLFAVELFAIYSPLYILSYKIANIDRVIDDKYLVWILLGITFIGAIILFPFLLSILAVNFF